MSQRDTDPPHDDALSDLCDAVDELTDAVEDALLQIGSSIRGIHGGIGDNDRAAQARHADLEQLVRGLAADVRTALTTLPLLNNRLITVEAALATLMAEDTPPEHGGNGATQ